MAAGSPGVSLLRILCPITVFDMCLPFHVKCPQQTPLPK
uniref:Uncharacterized protein n=1 Tax=Anguilla anguilla TaxID=7936 RepID=A0A0E9R8Y2_ANGAN